MSFVMPAETAAISATSDRVLLNARSFPSVSTTSMSVPATKVRTSSQPIERSDQAPMKGCNMGPISRSDMGSAPD